MKQRGLGTMEPRHDLGSEVMPKNPKQSVKGKPGPKPQYLKIEGDWRDAVKRAVRKKKPAEGWPK
jgi:hypothetical protein